MRKTAAAHHKRAGVDKGQIVAARPGTARWDIGDSNLAHRYRFPRQQRFIGLKIVGLHQYGVGGNAIAFGEDDQNAARDLAARDPSARAVADHQRTGTGEVAQCLQHSLGPRFLDDGDRDRHHRETEQDERFFQVSEEEIDKTATEQESEHRFAQNLENDAQRRTPVLAGQFVVSFNPQPLLCFGFAEAIQGNRRGATIVHEMKTISYRQSSAEARCDARPFATRNFRWRRRLPEFQKFGCPCVQALAPWIASMTAAVTSAVLALPPRSGVWKRLSAVTRSIACIRRSAALFSPKCSSIITADQKVPIGLATPLPMISKAEPWIGSNIEGKDRSGFRFAVG